MPRKIPKPQKPKKNPLTRAIEAKERAIEAAERRISKLYAAADEQAAKIRKNVDRTKVLLDALKRGALKP